MLTSAAYLSPHPQCLHPYGTPPTTHHICMKIHSNSPLAPSQGCRGGTPTRLARAGPQDGQRRLRAGQRRGKPCRRAPEAMSAPLFEGKRFFCYQGFFSGGLVSSFIPSFFWPFRFFVYLSPSPSPFLPLPLCVFILVLQKRTFS